MYKVGYIDDKPDQYEIFKRKLQRKNIELILFEECYSKKDFLEKTYETQSEVLLIDYKMVGAYGFNGTTLLSYLNNEIPDLSCYILTAVDQTEISDGLVKREYVQSKDIFDTEGGTKDRVERLDDFIEKLKESAEVYRRRRETKKEEYMVLLQKRKSHAALNLMEEEEFLSLYKILVSYGMVEELPEKLLSSQFEENLDRLLKIGEKILADYDDKKL